MAHNALYWFLVHVLGWLVGGGKLVGSENLPEYYPVVFVSNHAAALGPILVAASLPVRVHPWVVRDLIDRRRAPGYLFRDFIEPNLRIKPPFDVLLSRLISWLAVPLLKAIHCVPVMEGEGLQETFRLSREHLSAGRSLLVFPEDSLGSLNELFLMRPFKKGFTRLGEMYFRHTGRILRFYPLAVNPAARKVKVGRPVSYNPYNNVVRERLRLKRTLEAAVHNLYLSIILDEFAGVALPR